MYIYIFLFAVYSCIFLFAVYDHDRENFDQSFSTKVRPPRNQPAFTAFFFANVANNYHTGRWHRIAQSSSFHFVRPLHLCALVGFMDRDSVVTVARVFLTSFSSSRGNFKLFRRYEANFCKVPRRIELIRRLIIARLLIAGNDRQRRNRNG